MPTNINVAKYFDEDFAMELEGMIGGDDLGPHTEILLRHLSDPSSDYVTRLFDYGIKTLERLNERPDNSLALFFHALAFLKDASDEYRDLAQDAELYAETQGDFPIPRNKKQILESYKKLRDV